MYQTIPARLQAVDTETQSSNGFGHFITDSSKVLVSAFLENRDRRPYVSLI